MNSSILTAKFRHLTAAYRFLWLAYAMAAPCGALLYAAEHRLESVTAALRWLAFRFAAPSGGGDAASSVLGPIWLARLFAA